VLCTPDNGEADLGVPFNTKHVMNTILERSFKEGRRDMTPMKAQKMLFYTNGWHLATTGSAAITDPFAVWPYGPVVPSLYQDLKRFGAAPITAYVKDYFEEKPFVVNTACADLYESLDIAWEKYIGIDAITLSAMTHEPGGPWDVAKARGESTISNDLIREYFVRLANSQA
jgi:uncharacterized phage-associated protein